MRIYKKIALIFGLLALISPLVFAEMETMEDSSVSDQFNELQPFSHLSEGHWFAFILSLLLWLSLIYTIYSLVQRLGNKKKG